MQNHWRALLVIMLLIFVGRASYAQAIPENAWSAGGTWYCNDGYRKTANSCVKFDVPENAWVSGSSWYCNDGFKKTGKNCVRLTVPENAWVSGSSWYCNDGYRKTGTSCVKINIPANAFAAGSSWYCVEGYKRSSNKCVRMTKSEREQIARAAAEATARNTDGTIAYVTKVESDDDEIIKLENGAIVEVARYYGYIGYRKDAVLYGSGSKCFLWIAGKKSYKCELLKQPDGKPKPAMNLALDEVKGNGSILLMQDGEIYEVDDLDTIHTALWLGLSDGLLINGDTYINFDADEPVSVSRIR